MACSSAWAHTWAAGAWPAEMPRPILLTAGSTRKQTGEAPGMVSAILPSTYPDQQPEAASSSAQFAIQTERNTRHDTPSNTSGSWGKTLFSGEPSLPRSYRPALRGGRCRLGFVSADHRDIATFQADASIPQYILRLFQDRRSLLLKRLPDVLHGCGCLVDTDVPRAKVLRRKPDFNRAVRLCGLASEAGGQLST